jgi:hypothetical protein
MKTINRTLQLFLKEVTDTINLQDHLRHQEYEKLIEKWKRFIKKVRSLNNCPTEEFRKWHHIMLSVKWLKESLIFEKKSLAKTYSYF